MDRLRRMYRHYCPQVWVFYGLTAFVVMLNGLSFTSGALWPPITYALCCFMVAMGWLLHTVVDAHEHHRRVPKGAEILTVCPFEGCNWRTSTPDVPTMIARIKLHASQEHGVDDLEIGGLPGMPS